MDRTLYINGLTNEKNSIKYQIFQFNFKSHQIINNFRNIFIAKIIESISVKRGRKKRVKKIAKSDIYLFTTYYFTFNRFDCVSLTCYI